MKKSELESLKIMANEAQEILSEMNNDDFYAKDDDGAYTHNAMVIDEKLRHLLKLLCVNYKEECIKWYDYGTGI